MDDSLTHSGVSVLGKGLSLHLARTNELDQQANRHYGFSVCAGLGPRACGSASPGLGLWPCASPSPGLGLKACASLHRFYMDTEVAGDPDSDFRLMWQVLY